MQNRDISNAEQNPLDWHLRFASLERRITKLESAQQEMDRIVDPEGWIGEAFNVLETHMDQKFAEVDHQLTDVNAKLDIIMRHVTGMGQNN